MAPERAPRVVVIVGASSGIGRATAHVLARRGDRLVLASRSAAVLREVARECVAVGGPEPVVVPLDVTDRPAVERALAAARDRWGHVDAVVHTAAVLAYGRFQEIPADVFDRVVAVDVLGTANVARAALSTFDGQGGGHLVVVGSLLGAIPTAWMSPYVVSKWAVHGLAHVLRAETRGTGSAVSLVVPGGVDTPIYAAAGSYAGRQGRPPPPVDRPETVARAIADTLDHPRRTVSVGLANGPWTAAFRLTPGLYERVVGPAMARLGLSRTRVADHEGNVLVPDPERAAVHGAWGRHWLRGVGLAAGLAGLGAALAHGRRAR